MLKLTLAILVCLIANPKDGKGGFVFKVSGDHFPSSAVPVLPRKFVGGEAKVSVWASGKRVSSCKLKSSGICPGNPECLGRPTYLCPKSGRTYRRLYRSITIRARDSKGCTSWFIENPAKRVD